MNCSDACMLDLLDVEDSSTEKTLEEFEVLCDIVHLHLRCEHKSSNQAGGERSNYIQVRTELR